MLMILKAMIKEEWRMHSSLIGSLMFSFFPLLIILGTFGLSMLIPMLSYIVPMIQIIFFGHFILFVMGISVGAFGLMGKEVMNKRFGNASLVAYSIKNLPISEREIFANFFIKDVLYYLSLWVLPICAGIAIAVPLLHARLYSIILIFVSLPLSFMIGLSIVFLLSTIYANSIRVLFFIALMIVSFLYLFNFTDATLVQFLLPSYLFYISHSAASFVYSAALIIIPISLSFLFLKTEFREELKSYSNVLVKAAKFFSGSRYNFFIAKDYLDMKRSQGGIGKIIFSFLVPAGFGWLIISVFLKFFPLVDPLILFSIFVGVICSSVYGWLTDYDLYTSYSFLPVKVSVFIKSKMRSYAIINLLAPVLILFAASRLNKYDTLVHSMLVMFSVSYNALAIIVFLTGLYTNVYLYSPKVFLAYLALLLPIVLSFMIMSIFSPMLLLFSPLTCVIGWFMLKMAYKKWDRREQQSF